MVRKHITIAIERITEYSNLVCKYTFKKGESKGNRCYVRNYREGYCLKHFKLVHKIAQKSYKSKKDKICNNICKNNYLSKEKSVFKNSKKIKSTKLICYYNDPIYKKDISKIKIIDNISINKRSNPLLICFYNDNTLLNEDIKKIKKRIKNKNKKLKKKVKKLNRLKCENIKLTYLDINSLGFPFTDRIKSPFPDNKVIINNILYECSYYTFSRIHNEIKLYLIRLYNKKEEIITYNYYDFEKLLISIFGKSFVDTYFGY